MVMIEGAMIERMRALARTWRRPEILLLVMAAAVPLSFATWNALLNNFAIERAAFTGQDMGILQSLREVPGFLAFGIVAVILVLREQTVAYVSLLLLGLGTAATGWFPSVMGLWITTIIGSIGFHYYETVQTSLSLQWIGKDKAPETLGRIIAAGSLTSIVAFGLTWIAFDLAGADYAETYMAAGGLTALIAIACWALWPRYPEAVRQHRALILRPRYWLYYALTFMAGARRQIFIVFAGFLMVERFGFSVGLISALFLANAAVNMWLAPAIGRFIQRFGERRALICEYIGLILVFLAYAAVDDPWLAGVLYVLDNLFFALAIAIKTYFQKIADPADIAATAGVGFTINHIAAVIIPAAFGALWMVAPAAVFLAGAAMAAVSLALSFNVPLAPAPGREAILDWRPAPPPSSTSRCRDRPAELAALVEHGARGLGRRVVGEGTGLHLVEQPGLGAQVELDHHQREPTQHVGEGFPRLLPNGQRLVRVADRRQVHAHAARGHGRIGGVRRFENHVVRGERRGVAGAPLSGGALVPGGGARGVARDAEPVFVQHAEPERRRPVAPFGGAAVPARGLDEVAMDTAPLFVELAQAERRQRVALAGRAPVPVQCSVIVGRPATTLLEHLTERRLGVGVAVQRELENRVVLGRVEAFRQARRAADDEAHGDDDERADHAPNATPAHDRTEAGYSARHQLARAPPA
jgi:predicted MFS family arabinose efflux permease